MAEQGGERVAGILVCWWKKMRHGRTGKTGKGFSHQWQHGQFNSTFAYSIWRISASMWHDASIILGQMNKGIRNVANMINASENVRGWIGCIRDPKVLWSTRTKLPSALRAKLQPLVQWRLMQGPFRFVSQTHVPTRNRSRLRGALLTYPRLFTWGNDLQSFAASENRGISIWRIHYPMRLLSRSSFPATPDFPFSVFDMRRVWACRPQSRSASCACHRYRNMVRAPTASKTWISDEIRKFRIEVWTLPRYIAPCLWNFLYTACLLPCSGWISHRPSSILVAPLTLLLFQIILFALRIPFLHIHIIILFAQLILSLLFQILMWFRRWKHVRRHFQYDIQRSLNKKEAGPGDDMQGNWAMNTSLNGYSGGEGPEG